MMKIPCYRKILTSFLLPLYLFLSLPGVSPPVKAETINDVFIDDLFCPGGAVLIAKERLEKETWEEILEEDLDLLARIIFAEAEGEPYMGMVAVGSVVLNRVKSPFFPDTILGVIYDRDQFEPVRDGRLYLQADPLTRRAAKEALKGEDPSHGALYFYNRTTVQERGRFDLIQWFDENTRTTTIIGNHTFTQ